MVKFKMGWKVGLLGLALWLAPALGLAHPTIGHPVEDVSHALPSADVEDLSRRLVAHREATGVQMAVLVVDTTAGEPIEEFADGTFQAWGGGAAGRDDGLLVILAVRDHRSRIEVGRGLEERVTDGEARGLLDAARPDLRAGRLGSALRGIVSGLVRETGGGAASAATVAATVAPTAAPMVPRAPIRVRAPQAPSSDDGEGLIVGVVVFVLGAGGLGAWLLLRSNRRRVPHYGSYDYPSSALVRRPTMPSRATSADVTSATAPHATDPATSSAPRPESTAVSMVDAGLVDASIDLSRPTVVSGVVHDRREPPRRYDVAPDPKRSSRASSPAPSSARASSPPKPIAKQPEPVKAVRTVPSHQSSRRRDSDPPAASFGSGFMSGSAFGGSTRSSTPAGGSSSSIDYGSTGSDNSSTDWGGGGGDSDGGGSSGDW